LFSILREIEVAAIPVLSLERSKFRGVTIILREIEVYLSYPFFIILREIEVWK